MSAININNVWTNILDNQTGESVNFEEATTWVDGTPMDDAKVDGVVYRKLPISAGGGYVKRVFPDGFVNVKWFGAVGDGVADDTAAITIAVSVFNKVRFEAGKVYRTTSQISVVKDNIEWRGQGATIYVDNEIASAVDITGQNIIISQLNLNGNNLAQRGYYIRGFNITVNKCEIHSLLGRTSSGGGIRIANRTGMDLSNVVLTENYIHNISAPSDGTNGQGYGAARGIQIDSDTSITDRGIFIQFNRIEEITGREGDGIQFLFNAGGGSTIYEKTPSIVSNNYLKNCNRRYIKIQASNVSVNDNICENTLSVEEMYNASNGIGIIQGQDVNIYNNKVDGKLFAYGISISGNSDNPAPNIAIYNNVVESGTYSAGEWENDTYQRGIRVSDALKVRVYGNYITDNGKIQFANVTDSVISSNMVTASENNDLTTGVIDIDEDCNNIQIINNSGTGDTTSNPAMFINMNGQNCIIQGNKADYGNTNYSLIRFSETAFACIVSNNISASNSFNLVAGPNISENYIEFSNKGGTIGGGAKSIYFANSIPTSGNWRSGDIIIRQHNTSDGAFSRNVGWICILGTNDNTGGTWIPFGITNILSGPQIPEGNYQAVIGALYFRRPDNATAETAVYVKTVHGGNTGWKSLTGLATTTSTGLVLMAEASANSAAAVSSNYDQAEVQAILDELRDLKTKMRAAGLLDT